MKNIIEKRNYSINEMSDDIESQVCLKLQETEFLVFSIQYSVILYLVFNYLNIKDIPIANMISCNTDRAPNMIGCHKGLVSCIKEEIPNLFAIHCVCHRQHLCAKNLSGRLSDSPSLVIRVVNKIKARTLNTRLFRQLCNENDEQFERLLLHTEFQWLSKGSCLKIFFSLYDTIVPFILSVCENDLTNDIEKKLNLKLRDPNFNLIEAKSAVLIFMKKLVVIKQNIGRGEYNHFLNMESRAMAQHFSDSELHIYCIHLDTLKKGFECRFKDLVELVSEFHFFV
nr:protein ZBED8-like [Hydra vulgaris]